MNPFPGMTLESVQAHMRECRTGELAAVRAENALLKFYTKHIVPAHVPPRSRVLSVFNGRPITLMEVATAAGGSKQGIQNAITRLLKLNKIRRVGHGLYERVVLFLICLAVSGCVTKHTAKVTPIEDQGQRAVLRSAVLPQITAQAVATSPKGERITLAWDASPDADLYRLRTSTNKLVWSVAAETTATTAVISNLFAPVWFVATAVRGDDESVFSNIAGWLGNETIVTVNWETSPDLNQWTDQGQLFRGTNPLGMTFFRTRADSETRKVTE